MPLLKGKSSKSTPSAVMQYVTNPEKAAYVSVRNLFEDEDYAEQFTETMRRFNKGKKYDEQAKKKMVDAVEKIKGYSIYAIKNEDLEYKLIDLAKPKYNNLGKEED